MAWREKFQETQIEEPPILDKDPSPNMVVQFALALPFSYVQFISVKASFSP